jgi:hypothetical protein
VSETNGHNGNGASIVPPVPDPIVITEAQPETKPKRPRRKKHVPIAPAGTVPSGDVPWKARPKSGGETEIIKAQTWFFARAAAMALFACGPNDVEVTRA